MKFDFGSGGRFRELGRVVVLVIVSVWPFFLQDSAMSSVTYAAFCLVLGFGDPAWAVYALFVVTANYGYVSISEEATAVRLMAPIALITLWIDAARHGKSMRLRRSTAAVLVFAAYCLAITMIYGRITSQFLGAAALAVSLSLFVQRDGANHGRVATAFVLAVLVSVIAGVIKGNYSDAGYTMRFLGGNTDPNEFARYVLLGIAFADSITWRSKLARQSVTVCLWGALLSTYSRMGFVIGAGVVVVRMFSIGTVRPKARSQIVAGMVAIAVVVLATGSFSQLLQTTGTAWGRRFKYEARPMEYSMGDKRLYWLNDLTAGRLDLQAVSLQEYSREAISLQLAGGGYNYSRDLLAGQVGKAISTHSAFLQVLVDFGAFGLVLFLAVCVLSLDRTHKQLGRFLNDNLAWFVYVGSFLALAWVFSWSNLMFFACVGTRPWIGGQRE